MKSSLKGIPSGICLLLKRFSPFHFAADELMTRYEICVGHNGDSFASGLFLQYSRPEKLNFGTDIIHGRFAFAGDTKKTGWLGLLFSTNHTKSF